MPKQRTREKEERLWALLQAGISAPLVIASHKLAVRAWNVLTGEDPPVAGTPVHGEENKEAMRRFLADVINKQNPDAIDEFVAERFVEHSTLPGTGAGREALRTSLMVLFSAFPDFHSEEQELIAERDKVVYRGVARGTHQGEFMGRGPTGRRFEAAEVHIARFADGKLLEHWRLHDAAAVEQQLTVAA